MQTNRTNEVALVVAAQAGDRRAIEDLLTARLPLVYTIVRRAMGSDPDVDDVVQETMLRALRELPKLLHPESFRAWLSAIAVRQISTHQHRGRRWVRRTTDLDDLPETAEAEPGFEETSVLSLELAGQRRQLVRARRWLDPKDRTLLSLWWLETAGQLTRAEVAEALGASIAHTSVRIQRMRAQLDLSRALEAAVEAGPRCADLDVVLHDWDGRTNSLWRKRIARHTRSCPVCLRRADGLVAPEHLLVALTFLPVPVTVAAGLLGKVALAGGAVGTPTAALTGGKAGFAAHAMHAVVAHPVTVMLVTGSVVTGTAVTTSNWPDNRTTPPVVIAIPSSPPTLTLGPGPTSLEAVTTPGEFVSTTQTLGVLTKAGPGSSQPIRARATFEVVAGLADPNCFSFRLADGQYLRHSSWRLRTFANDRSALFRGDATFCPAPGSTPGAITLESSNYPGWFLHHRSGELWVDHADGSDRFLADSSFRVRSPLTG